MFSRLKNGFGRELNMLEGVMLAAANDPRALDYATLAARCRTRMSSTGCISIWKTS
jgi:hypothetical protein